MIYYIQIKETKILTLTLLGDFGKSRLNRTLAANMLAISGYFYTLQNLFMHLKRRP